MFAIIVHGLLFLIGLDLSSIFGVKSTRESIGLAYLFGSSVTSILMVLNYQYVFFAFDTTNLFFSIFLIFSILKLWITFFSKNKSQSIKNKINHLVQNANYYRKKTSIIDIAMVFILILLILHSLLENTFWPITDWDAIALYDFRAKTIADTHDLLSGLELGYFFQYPLYTSFLHLIAHFFNEPFAKVAYSFIYSSFIVLFYSLVRRHKNRSISLLATTILASSRYIFDHSTIAYTNLAYVTFFSIGIIYLWQWLFSIKSITMKMRSSEQHARSELIVGSILVALSTWTRMNDPFWLLAVCLIIYGLLRFKKNIIQGTFSIASILIISFIWKQFLQYIFRLTDFPGSTTDLETSLKTFFSHTFSFSELINRAISIIWYITKVFIDAFGVLLLLLLTIDYKKCIHSEKNAIMAISIIFLVMIIVVGSFIFSFSFPSWNEISGSVSRMSMILIPLFLFFVTTQQSWLNKK